MNIKVSKRINDTVNICNENNVWELCTVLLRFRTLEDTCGVNSLTELSITPRHKNKKKMKEVFAQHRESWSREYLINKIGSILLTGLLQQHDKEQIKEILKRHEDSDQWNTWLIGINSIDRAIVWQDKTRTNPICEVRVSMTLSVHTGDDNTQQIAQYQWIMTHDIYEYDERTCDDAHEQRTKSIYKILIKCRCT